MFKEGINSGLQAGYSVDLISRKIYTVYPTFAFDGDYDIQFEIFNLICSEFDVPITAIQVCGSAKTGFNFNKNTEYKRGSSDLDIAIVDSLLFQKYCEIVLKETYGFRDLSNFTEGNARSYYKYIAKGFFRPDFMPTCIAKREWQNFFNKLSVKYIDMFSNINAGIYFSQTFFELKQASNIDLFKTDTL
ncbi:MAG: hypothetical protein JWP94_1969 [Mucilaginibacter sp.]|nr:hypothetical protein [Mucilaginibacter sp.]